MTHEYRRKLLGLVLVSFALKIIYLALASFLLNEPMDLGVFKRHDAFWYESIATNGYEPTTPDQLGSCEDGHIEQSNYAFFPLYPYILRGAILLFGIGFNLAAFLLSLILCIPLCDSLLRLGVAEGFSLQQSFAGVLLMLLFPFGFYFSMYYTEALFLTLLAYCWWGMRTKRYWVYVLAASAMVITRPNGLFLLLPLLIVFLENHTVDWRHWAKTMQANLMRIFRIYFIPIATFLLFCTFLYLMTGDFFAYKTAQAGWCVETVFPWEPILSVDGQVGVFRLTYLMVFALLCAGMWRMFKPSHIILIAVSIGLPLMANAITLPRFLALLFPFFFALATKLNSRGRFVSYSAMAVLFGFQLWTFSQWLNSSPLAF